MRERITMSEMADETGSNPKRYLEYETRGSYRRET